MKFRSWVRCGVWGLVALGQPSAALAGEATGSGAGETLAPFALEYVASRECPARTAVLAAVAERDKRLVESEQAPAERHFRIVVEAAARRFAGRLEQPALGSVRQVTGRDCAKVVEALSLVLALAAGATQHQDEPAPLVDLEAASDPPSSDAQEASAARRPQPAQAPRKAPRPAPDAAAETRSSPPGLRTSALEWAVGVGGASLWGGAPVLLAGPAVTLERTHDAGWLFVRLVGRLGYGIQAPGNRLQELIPQLGVRASFGVVDLALQTGLAVGELQLERGTDASNLWVTPLLGPVVRVHPSPRWWVELGVEGGVPLLARRVQPVAGSSTTETESLTVGLCFLGGFGEPQPVRIRSAAVGHSSVK